MLAIAVGARQLHDVGRGGVVLPATGAERPADLRLADLNPYAALRLGVVVQSIPQGSPVDPGGRVDGRGVEQGRHDVDGC